MPVKYRFLPILALILLSAVALSGCLPADPVQGARLSAAKKIMEKLPAVVEAHSENSNGLAAGQRSSFSLTVHPTATPAQLEDIIVALPQALKGTKIGSVRLFFEEEGGDMPISRRSRGDVRVEIPATSALPELLAARERILAATDVPFLMDVGESSVFDLYLDSPDVTSLEPVTSVLREVDAIVYVNMDNGPGVLTSSLLTNGEDFPAALDLWALALAGASSGAPGDAIRLEPDDAIRLDTTVAPWTLGFYTKESSIGQAEELVEFLNGWTKRTHNSTGLFVDISWPSNGGRALVRYELTSAGQTCTSTIPSLCH